MAINVPVKDKSISNYAIWDLFIEGEANAETVVFVVDPVYSGLTWAVRATMADGSVAVSAPITPTESATQILVPWTIASAFCAVPGVMHLTLVGSNQAGTFIVKAVGKVEVKADWSIGDHPVITEDLYEQLIAQIEDAVHGAQDAADSILALTASASVDNNTGTPSVNVTVGEADGHKTMTFAFHNLKGDKGNKGDAGTISAVNASVDNSTGIPSCDVTLGGTPSNRTITLSFHNLKGASGAGTGDMLKSEYDNDDAVRIAGGIAAFISAYVSANAAEKVHTHAASQVTAGTLAGKTQANASAAATLTDAQIRDILATSSDIAVGAQLATGTIALVYTG